MENKIEASYKITLSIYKTGEELGMKPHAVWRFLKKNNVTLDSSKSCRKYELINEDLFLEINHDWEAYFLGLICADGCVTKDSIRVSLIEGDKNILEKISKLTFVNKNLRFVKKRENTHKNQMSIEICNKKIVENIKKLGVPEKKSLILQFPKIKDEHMNHFIRGYFDGDGSINRCNKINENKYGCNIIGSIPFVTELHEILKKVCARVNFSLCNGERSARINIWNKKDILKLYDYMYKNCKDLYIDRKKIKFEKMIKEVNWDKLNATQYSKVVGVTFDKRRGHWIANIKRDKKVKFIGSFSKEREAIVARKIVEKDFDKGVDIFSKTYKIKFT